MGLEYTIFALVTVIVIVVLVGIGVVVLVRDTARSLGAAAKHEALRDQTYKAFVAAFKDHHVPTVVTQEAFDLLWEDILWAVQLEVGPETRLVDLYRVHEDGGTRPITLLNQLARRCGLRNPERFTGDYNPSTVLELMADAVQVIAIHRGRVPDRLVLLRSARQTRKIDEGLLRSSTSEGGLLIPSGGPSEMKGAFAEPTGD